MITTITLQKITENQLKVMAMYGFNGMTPAFDQVTKTEMNLIIVKAVERYCNQWQANQMKANKSPTPHKEPLIKPNKKEKQYQILYKT